LELKLTDLREIVQSLVNDEEVHVRCIWLCITKWKLILYLVTTCCPMVPVTA